MKTIDLFRAYVQADRKCGHYREQRTKSRGILVGTDYYALAYQRKNRLRHRLLQRILCRLDPTLIDFYKEKNICRKCGYQPSACSCAGGHAPVKHWDAHLGEVNKTLRGVLYTYMYPDPRDSDEYENMMAALKVLSPVAGIAEEYEEWIDHLPF